MASNPNSGESSAARRSHQQSVLPIGELQPTHQRILVRALSNVWNTHSARIAYGQILDGAPVPALCRNKAAFRSLPIAHPAWKEHRELCPGVMDKLKEFREQNDLTKLKLDSQALSQYRAASPHSRAFNTRLIELVSRGVHQIAVELFSWGQPFHTDDAFTSWIPPKDDSLFWEFHPDGPLPTWFTLSWYKDFGEYPNGAADLAGYWVENLILGGVALFDRRPPEEGEPDAVYFHSQYTYVTYRIYKLLDSQKKQLLDFLYGNADALQEADVPLPILGDENNLARVDPEEPIDRTGIYRDIWERKPLPDDAFDPRTKDVISSIDYPRRIDWDEAGARAAARKEEILDRLYPDRPPLPW